MKLTSSFHSADTCDMPLDCSLLLKYKQKVPKLGVHEVDIYIVFHFAQVEGVYYETGQSKLLRDDNPDGLCPLCPHRLKAQVKYTVGTCHNLHILPSLFHQMCIMYTCVLLHN